MSDDGKMTTFSNSLGAQPPSAESLDLARALFSSLFDERGQPVKPDPEPCFILHPKHYDAIVAGKTICPVCLNTAPHVGGHHPRITLAAQAREAAQRGTEGRE